MPSPPPPSSPFRSEQLRSNPSARAYLLRNAGQDILVTLEEARQWFQQGFTIYDPNTRQIVDIGGVAIPSYAEGQGAFVRQDEEETQARNALAEEKAKSNADEKGCQNGMGTGHYRNGNSGGAAGSTAT